MSDTSDTPMEEPQGDLPAESDVDLVDDSELDEIDDLDGDAQDDDDEEIEIRGQRRKAKEVLEILAKADSLQSDYTKKTMALAEKQRIADRGVELVKAIESRITGYDDVVSDAERQIAEIDGYDWSAFKQQYPEQFAEAYAEAQLAKHKLITDAQTKYHAAEELRQQKASFEYQQLVNAVPELQDPVKGEQLGQKIGAVMKHFGIQQMPDHRFGVMLAQVVPLLEKAAKYDELLKRKDQKTRQKAVSNAPEPPAPVRSASPSKAGLNDDLPMDEWLKRREAQLKRR